MQIFSNSQTLRRFFQHWRRFRKLLSFTTTGRLSCRSLDASYPNWMISGYIKQQKQELIPSPKRNDLLEKIRDGLVGDSSTVLVKQYCNRWKFHSGVRHSLQVFRLHYCAPALSLLIVSANAHWFVYEMGARQFKWKKSHLIQANPTLSIIWSPQSFSELKQTAKLRAMLPRVVYKTIFSV